MKQPNFHFTILILICLVAFSQSSFGQYTTTVCQTVTDALIGPDRNDWAHANLPIVNEGYLHNFDPPTLPCGINNPNLTSLGITIDITNISTSPGCAGIPIFGNVLLNCPLAIGSVCPIIQDVLTPGCGTFGGGATTTGTYFLDIVTCNAISITDIIGVDIIPATDFSPSCPSNGSAITDGTATVTYEICLDYTYDQAVPPDCTNTTSLPCDDGDPCTTGDVELVDFCDNTIVCTPCAGTPIPSCTNTTDLPCDDGDPCTTGDMQTVEACDNTIVCVPCAGTPVPSCTNTTDLPCDDGDPNTYDDQETILDCDGTICIPCAGTPCNVTAFIPEPVLPLTCQSMNTGIVLEGTGSSSGPEITYTWLFMNTVIGMGLTLEVFDEGIYTLLVTDNSNGCFNSYDIEIVIPVVDLEPLLTVNGESCPGQQDGSIYVDTVLGGHPPYLYAFNSNVFESTNLFANLLPGVYSLNIQDADGCESIIDITIPVSNELFVNLGPDQSVVLGGSLQLAYATNLIVDSIRWDFDESLSCTNCSEPFIYPTYSTTYTVTLTDVNGCVVTDQIEVFVDRTERIFIPNTFSPNGDGINDFFTIYAGSDVRLIRNFRVFDRWGGTLFAANNFHPNDQQLGWDGKYKGAEMDAGVYVYYVEIEFADGRTELKSGDLIIVK